MLGFVFYIWVGIFSLATIAQFWSFANDIYRKDVGNRLFPLIAIGQTAGAMVGSKVVEELFKARVDPFMMMHITAVLVLVHLGLYVDRQPAAAPEHTAKAAAPAGGRAAAGSRWSSRARYLLTDRRAAHPPERDQHARRVRARFAS